MKNIGKICSALLLSFTLDAATIQVSNTNDAGAGSLRAAILASATGDTIECMMVAGGTITLMSPLPAITHTLTIQTSTGAALTISGNANMFQIFQVASGTTTLTNLTLQDAASRGGVGGAGATGGGGGVGGGGAIYVHNGASVSTSTVQFISNQAIGGVGGAGAVAAVGSGGGGGGFGGGGGNNGGAGILAGGGGGGGGNSGGGSGGSPGGNGTNSGGGGGGNAGQAGGTSGSFTAGAAGGGNGGGGAGAGGNGNNGAGSTGGAGGIGIGSDTTFGGGGGGGGTTGGAGSGTGGGGGGGTTGGAGGTNGGGGGGGTTTGGMGGFGAGGGGGTTGGTTVFGSVPSGGGVGGSSVTGGGGGGSGLGGSIFVQNNATFTVNDANSFPNSSTVTAGAGGAGGVAGTAGTALGPEIFIRSGGTLIFNLTTSNLTISSAIDSDQNLGGGTGGGLTMSGTRTLTLATTNTYSGGTTISSGILNVSTNPALGKLTDGVTINVGTFQAGGSFTSPRAFTLSGAATIDTVAGGTTLTLSGTVSGSGSLTKISPGTLTLQGTNTYSGGTTITGGTLSISSDSNLGHASGSLSISNATLQMTSSVTSARSVTLASGNATFDTGAAPNNDVFSGVISGSGTLVKISTGTLTLSGTNSYSGGTQINAGTLSGNSNSLQGAIQNNAALIFNQTGVSGTYAGALSGAGTLSIQNGSVTFSGNSATFSGATTLSSGGQLIVNGSLAGSMITVNAGTVLGGSGTVGTVANAGAVSPGNGPSGTGILTVMGNYSGAGILEINISPLAADLLDVTGTANLTGQTLSIIPLPGFYGVAPTYLIVDSNTLGGSTFASVTVSDPNFQPTVFYVPGGAPNQVVLSLRVLNPFLNFPFGNANEESVGLNIGSLNASNLLTPDLIAIIDSFAGGTPDEINNALDQMHPAGFSAFSEMQVDVNSGLLSYFHRRPYLRCHCYNRKHFWVQPFGNWLKLDNKGDQAGFEVDTKGIAIGADREFGEGWILGLGGAFDDGHLVWHKRRGHADTEGWYGAFYTDYQAENFYIGGALLGGIDVFETRRKLQFFTTDTRANGKFYGLDFSGQFAAAYFFGVPVCHLFPYFNGDAFYLRTTEVKESGAGGLNLIVEPNQSMTLRGELGVGLQVQDTNALQTMCISPLIALSWVFEYPLEREVYNSRFIGEPISFTVKGWKEFWEIFKVDFGLMFTYKCFTLSGGYNVEISPGGREYALFSQRGNVRVDWNW